MDQSRDMKRPTNPREGANFFSVLTFGYMIPILIKGYFKEIKEEDVPKILDCYCASKLGDKLEKSWKKETDSGSVSLWIAIRRVFGIEFAIFGILSAIDSLVLRLIQPIALAELLKRCSLDARDQFDTHEVFIIAAVIVGVSILSQLITHFTEFNLQVLGMKIRIACCSLIYRKALMLSKSALANSSAGQITNLLSNDVSRIDSAAFNAHSVWKAPFQISLIVVIMYEMLGIKSTIGILFLACFVPIQVWLGSKLSKLRLKIALQTDTRLRLMTEILYGIKIIKMYAWEEPFKQLVLTTRRMEISEIRKANYIRSFMKFAVFSPKLATTLIVIVSTLTGNSVTALYVYTIILFYDTLKQTLGLSFIKGIADVAEVQVCVSRIKNFLLHENQIKQRRQDNKNIGIELNNATAKWCSSSEEAILKKITLQIYPGEHVAIVGPVGSGKSSILELILEEMQVQDGSINVMGKVSYASQEPWVFSGNVQQNILFGKPMNEIRYKNVLHVCALENDLQCFAYGDQTLVGERGVIVSGGQKARINLARAIYADADIYLLDDPFSAVDTHVGQHIFKKCIKEFLSSKCVLLVSHQLQYLHTFNRIYLIENGQICATGTTIDIFQDDSNYSDKSKGTGQDHHTLSDECFSRKKATNYENKNCNRTNILDLSSSASNNRLFSYIKAGGTVVDFLVVMSLIALSQLSMSGLDYLLFYWIKQNKKFDGTQESNLQVSETTFLYAYSGITIFMIITVLCQSYAFFSYCTSAAVQLHDKMFSGIIKTSLLFFNLNTSGTILKRFSKDMGLIDEQMPMSAMDIILLRFRLVLSILLICLTNSWLILHSIFLLFGFYFLRHLYYATNRKVQLFELNAQNLVYGHLNETLQGLNTVRAFGAQEILRKEFDHHLNFHSSMFYLFLSTTRTLIFYVDILLVAYNATILFTLLLLQTEHSAENIGLAMILGTSLLTSQAWGTLQSTQLENQMVSVERAVEYSKLEPEEKTKLEQPSCLWPEQGAIEFKAICLKYSPQEPIILKNICFNVRPNEKIGVVGRTGAGKSSLIAALFQLVRTEGAIIIDGINIAAISLHSLRSKLSIIPQEPVLFSGALRRNLDPFNHFPDEELWLALDEVELKSFIAELPQGLNYVVSEGGCNLSVGQRQLICLARAILRKNKILVLDEATANVDSHTDRLIQTTLRKRFKNCTVLTVAHRLTTIMDNDKVLVLKNGQVVEFDHPHVLLQNNKGLFYNMVQQTGNDKSKSLARVAEDNFKGVPIYEGEVYSE